MTDLAPDSQLQFHRMSVDNLSCAGCAARAEKALNGLPGVVEARVNFATRRADIRTEGATAPDALAPAMAAAGYPLRPLQSAAPAEEDGSAKTVAVAVAALLSLPVVIMEMGGHLFPAFHHWLHGLIGLQTIHLLQFALTTAVLFGPGRVFFRLGLPALRRRAPEMNSLVALGAGTAWAWSSLVVFAPAIIPNSGAYIYFEAAALIVTLILVGRLLEARARGRAGAAIAGLMALRPDTAIRIVGGEEVETPLDAIRPGDMLRIRPGARIPVDGTVDDGTSEVDEAMLTGEPLPVDKAPGAALSAGTVNGTGALTMRAEAVGADTALGRIVALVEDAQATRLPVQALINRVTAIFVPVVIAIALLAAAIWLLAGATPGDALVRLVSVLIIACPCAMGLATPVSILAGTGRAAELGVLFRKGAALQTLGTADLIAFDKTVTLSFGRFTVTDITGAPDTLHLAAAVDAGSEHPLARALVEAARGDTLPEATDFVATPGGGASAKINGIETHVGSAAFLRAKGIDAPDGDTTQVHVGAEGRLIGTISLADTAKPDAANAIAALQSAGKRVAILSGDAQGPVDRLAADLQVQDAHGGLSPEDKQSRVAAWQAEGLRVAFVGDGLNDAPVLAAADIGVALGTGTDVAMEAADVVLRQGHVASVPAAIEVSQKTLANIRQNLVWAFGYNVALIPVAAGLLIPFGGPGLNPMLGAGAMAASSVLVVLNALRLRRIGGRV